jgi:hypothetical protein
MNEVNLSAVLSSGVYILRLRGRVVYIGRAKSALARVYAHKRARRGQMPRSLDSLMAPVVFDEVWLRPCRVDQLDEAYAAACAELNFAEAA